MNSWPVSRSALAAAGAAGFAYAVAFGAGEQETDVVMTYLPAWRLVHGHGLALPAGQGIAFETVHTVSGQFSDRMPGLIALAAPSQVLAAGPSSWTVRFVTAALIALAVFSACRLWGGPGCALLLVTPLLSVAGRTLWPETAVAALLLAMLLASRSARGLPFLLPLAALCVLVRPPSALLLTVILLDGRPGGRRRFAWLAAGVLAGAATLATYDELLFSRLLPAGTYGVHPHGLSYTWSALWIGLVSPARGVLFYAPWLAWAIQRRGWSPAIGVGTLYVLGSWWDSGAWAGTGFIGVRYPIPLLLLAFPVLWARFGSSRWFRVSCVWSGAWTVVGLLTPIVISRARDPWLIPVSPAVLLTTLVGWALVASFGPWFAAAAKDGVWLSLRERMGQVEAAADDVSTVQMAGPPPDNAW